jgi:hypothetical protein
MSADELRTLNAGIRYLHDRLTAPGTEGER